MSENVRDVNARRKIPECGHPERKHYAKGMCQPCYQRDYKLDEVGQERRREAQKTYQANNPDRYVRRGTFRDEDADYAEWQSLDGDIKDGYIEALSNQSVPWGSWSGSKLDWVCFRMWQREMRESEQEKIKGRALEALRPTEIEIEEWLIEAAD